MWIPRSFKKKKTLKNQDNLASQNRKSKFGKKSGNLASQNRKKKVDSIFIGNKPTPPQNYEEPFEEPFEGLKTDNESITYNGKTFEKGDTVKFSTKKEGKLIKIGKKVIIVLRNDNSKERRLKVEDFIKFNF